MSLRFCRGCTRSLFYSFQHGSFIHCGCGKLRGSDSNGENAEWLGGKPVKKEKKRPRLSFGKKKILLHFSPKPSMENAGKYITYKNQSQHLWKTGVKSGKHSGKLPLFFTNSVENTVEKVDKSIRQHQKWITGRFGTPPRRQPSPLFTGSSLNGPAKHGTIKNTHSPV